MSKTMTYDDYLRLTGLLALAADHRTMLKAIERSAAAIVGISMDSADYAGHVSDCIWGENYSPADLLRRLDIAVPTPPDDPFAVAERQIANAAEMVRRFQALNEENDMSDSARRFNDP